MAPDSELRIGIDLDNTIVCYEDLFAELARERGLSTSPGMNRIELRDRLRREGREELWTEMQGDAYGPRMRDAEPFAGAAAFVQRCAESGVALFIVSHRTRHPYRGEHHDLHAAAREWLERHAFVGGNGIATDDVFLELDRERKLDRIVTLRCTHFIDDLPEIFEHRRFPQATKRILFDPAGAWTDATSCARAASWSDVETLIFRFENRDPRQNR